MGIPDEMGVDALYTRTGHRLNEQWLKQLKPREGQMLSHTRELYGRFVKPYKYDADNVFAKMFKRMFTERTGGALS